MTQFAEEKMEMPLRSWEGYFTKLDRSFIYSDSRLPLSFIYFRYADDRLLGTIEHSNCIIPVLPYGSTNLSNQLYRDR